MPNSRVILAPQLDALYLELNPSERTAQRSMILNADFVVKGPDESLTDIINRRYGETLSPETRQVLETAIRFANGVSRGAQTGPIVALPQTEDLEKIMRRLYMEVDVEAFRAESGTNSLKRLISHAFMALLSIWRAKVKRLRS